MSNIGAYAAKAMLDWVLGGAVPVQPTTRVAALSFGLPTNISAMGEIQDGSGYERQMVPIGEAASPAGSASNTAFMTFGPFSSSQTLLGVLIYDTPAINSGNILWYGSMLTPRTVNPGDRLIVGLGALTITLS